MSLLFYVKQLHSFKGTMINRWIEGVSFWEHCPGLRVKVCPSIWSLYLHSHGWYLHWVNGAHIPHIGVSLIVLVVPEAQEIQADQLQDHPEKHKHSLDLDFLNCGGIKLTIKFSLLRTMINRHDEVYTVYRVFVPFLPLFLDHQVYLGTLELQFLPAETWKEKQPCRSKNDRVLREKQTHR